MKPIFGTRSCTASGKVGYLATRSTRGLWTGSRWVGTGSGSYTFIADRAFVSALQQMGYDSPDDEQLLSMLMMDIDRRFAREIHDSGLRASSQDLIGLKIHGVSLDYIREARRAGYETFTADDYVQLRIHGVGTDFLRELRAAGYDLRAGDITQLRIHGVDSGYVRELKDYGLKPDASDLTQMRIHGVTPEYLKGLKDAGYEKLRADEINQLRIHGVATDFVQQATRLGYNFTPQELAQLRIAIGNQANSALSGEGSCRGDQGLHVAEVVAGVGRASWLRLDVRASGLRADCLRSRCAQEQGRANARRPRISGRPSREHARYDAANEGGDGRCRR